MPSNSAIFYDGPSLLTGDPIVGVVSGLTLPSGNPKTGPMLQAWILRSDMTPSEAVRSGADRAICGDCALRSGSNIGRACYVIWWLAPARIFSTLDRLDVIAPWNLSKQMAGRYLRVGAYGDPAAIPTRTWSRLLEHVAGWVGYTHQWRTCDPELKAICMASVDNEPELGEAQAAGWRTFRARQASARILEDEVVCPASTEANHSTTCQDCQLCRGTARAARSVSIVAHGLRVRWFPKAPEAVLA